MDHTKTGRNIYQQQQQPITYDRPSLLSILVSFLFDDKQKQNWAGRICLILKKGIPN